MFTQQKTSKDSYLISDIETNALIELKISLMPEESYSEGQIYMFEMIKITTGVYGGYNEIIDSLIDLADASIETGNPIVWV